MRTLVAIVVVVLVIGLAGSWLLGWWDVSTDKEKMNQDIDRIKHIKVITD
jgi:hypothetical protein